MGSTPVRGSENYFSEYFDLIAPLNPAFKLIPVTNPFIIYFKLLVYSTNHLIFTRQQGKSYVYKCVYKPAFEGHWPSRWSLKCPLFSGHHG